MKFLKQFYEILQGRRLLIALSVSSGLLFAGANLVPPLLIRELIQWLTEGGGNPSSLLHLTLLLLAVYLLRGLARFGYGRFSHVASYQGMHDLMTRVYRHIQRLPHSFFHRERTGSLISRSINDVEAVEVLQHLEELRGVERRPAVEEAAAVGDRPQLAAGDELGENAGDHDASPTLPAVIDAFANVPSPRLR